MRRSEAQDLNSGEHLKGVLSPQRVFQDIGLTAGASLLDAGCGEGRFSLAASEIVEKRGMVYALDISEERVAALQRTVVEPTLGNVRAFVADVREHVCVDEDVIDVLLDGERVPRACGAWSHQRRVGRDQEAVET